LINEQDTFILIHSPLVGPLTWSLVAGEIRQHGLDVIVPTLHDSPDSKVPFWKQHAESVSQALSQIPKDTFITMVAHSGAGPLLPVIRQSIPNPARSYILVDAGIPRDGATRLDLMKLEDPEWAAQFQQYLESGGRFPDWSIEDLQEVLPDETLRRQLVAELRPRGLGFFAEPIPVFEGWPDALCTYIKFSPPYEYPALQARQAGWLVHEMEAGHFHMLVDPGAVTDLLIEAVNKPS
jgi:hypothetical protein